MIAVALLASTLALAAAPVTAMLGQNAPPVVVSLYNEGPDPRAEKIDEARMLEIFGACRFEGPNPVELLRIRTSAFASLRGKCAGPKAVAKEITVFMDLAGNPNQVSIYRGLVIFTPAPPPPAANQPARKVGSAFVSETVNG